MSHKPPLANSQLDPRRPPQPQGPLKPTQTQPQGPHAVSGRFVRLERGGRNNALLRAEAITVQGGHVVLVEELHPLDNAAISMEYAERALWAGVSGRKQ